MIYENVLKLCEEHKVTVAALERTLGLGNATIRGWAKSDPRVSTIKAVADYFGVTIEDLMADPSVTH